VRVSGRQPAKGKQRPVRTKKRKALSSLTHWVALESLRREALPLPAAFSAVRLRCRRFGF
jgi:hypothetical protein